MSDTKQVSQVNGDRVTRAYVPPFPANERQEIELTLKRVAQKVDISWEWLGVDGLNGGAMILLITGIDSREISIGHWKSARAFLDAYLMGYEQGYDDGRSFYVGLDDNLDHGPEEYAPDDLGDK